MSQDFVKRSEKVDDGLDTTFLNPNIELVESESGNQAGNAFLPTAPKLGETYRIVECVGVGGMGTVWKVHDTALGITLAVKVLRPELAQNATALSRFEQEARISVDLTHENIAAVYGPRFDLDGRPCIVMNYIEGKNLRDMLACEGKLEPDRALSIFLLICKAISHAHMKGVVHRDIKPSNIIVSPGPHTENIRVVDFGISKSIYGDVRSSRALTDVEDFLGTPSYISPEQCLGLPVTAQTDIYAIGCVFFEMLAGQPPFVENNAIRLIVRQLSEAPDLTLVPKRFRGLLELCLQKDPLNRPKTIDDLLNLLNKSQMANPETSASFSSVWIHIPGLLTLFLLHSLCFAIHDIVWRIAILDLVLCIVATIYTNLRIGKATSVVSVPVFQKLEAALLTVLVIAPFLLLAEYILAPNPAIYLPVLIPVIYFQVFRLVHNLILGKQQAVRRLGPRKS